jgi:hypothetical protein
MQPTGASCGANPAHAAHSSVLGQGFLGTAVPLCVASRHITCLVVLHVFALQINVVMDYANGGSLFEYVQARSKLPEALAR